MNNLNYAETQTGASCGISSSGAVPRFAEHAPYASSESHLSADRRDRDSSRNSEQSCFALATDPGLIDLGLRALHLEVATLRQRRGPPHMASSPHAGLPPPALLPRSVQSQRPEDRSAERHLSRSSSRPVWISDLHRRTSYSDHCTLRREPGVMSVSFVPDQRVGRFIVLLIAITDRKKPRHRTSLGRGPYRLDRLLRTTRVDNGVHGAPERQGRRDTWTPDDPPDPIQSSQTLGSSQECSLPSLGVIQSIVTPPGALLECQ